MKDTGRNTEGSLLCHCGEVASLTFGTRSPWGRHFFYKHLCDDHAAAEFNRPAAERKLIQRQPGALGRLHAARAGVRQ